ncbi:EthD domain-containing protein [Xylaria nigripes]|nr:EthD domain-containing protein [Xylaria nigripes]
MTFILLAFLSRKQGTTPEEFKAYYTKSHLPMFRELAGPLVPLKHKQHYIYRTKTENSNNTTPRNPHTPATVFRGTQADFDYDVMVTLEFKDAEAFQRHLDFVQKPEIAAKIAEDEERFLDRSRTITAVVGDVIETTTA